MDIFCLGQCMLCSKRMFQKRIRSMSELPGGGRMEAGDRRPGGSDFWAAAWRASRSYPHCKRGKCVLGVGSGMSEGWR